MSILKAVIGAGIVLMVLATAVPVIWPMVVNAGGNVTAMSGTDAGTTTFKGFWPIILMLVGLGMAIGGLAFAYKKFNLGGTMGF